MKIKSDKGVATGKSSVSLEGVVSRLERSKERCEDIVVPYKDITYKPGGLLKIKDAGTFALTDYSFGQMCTRLKLPAEFIRRSPEEDGPASQKAIFDYWMSNYSDEGEKEAFVRLKKADKKDKETGAIGHVRAVLTTRFTPFDNLELVDAISDLVGKGDDQLRVLEAKTTDKSFHLRLVFPEPFEIGKTNGKADIHNFGVHLANSEVGARNITADMFLWRIVCKNGLIAMVERDHLFTSRHINIKREEIKQRIAAGVDRLHDRTEETVERLIELQEDFPGRNVAQQLTQARAEIRRVLRGNHASKSFVDEALERFDREPIPSTFGVVQAITSAAKKLKIDERVEMEELAGSLLQAA